MKKWEYIRVGIDKNYEDKMNEFGQKGWELVAVIDGSYMAGNIYCFKREKIEQEDSKPLVKITAKELILSARMEQIQKHGFTKEYDHHHNSRGQLLDACRCILNKDAHGWPFDEKWLKKITSKPRLDQLAISGAFILAEEERTGIKSDSFQNTYDFILDRMDEILNNETPS